MESPIWADSSTGGGPKRTLEDLILFLCSFGLLGNSHRMEKSRKLLEHLFLLLCTLGLIEDPHKLEIRKLEHHYPGSYSRGNLSESGSTVYLTRV